MMEKRERKLPKEKGVEGGRKQENKFTSESVSRADLASSQIEDGENSCLCVFGFQE
jgi:hypothetical protein